jgi:hypothetical protein
MCLVICNNRDTPFEKMVTLGHVKTCDLKKR